MKLLEKTLTRPDQPDLRCIPKKMALKSNDKKNIYIQAYIINIIEHLNYNIHLLQPTKHI